MTAGAGTSPQSMFGSLERRAISTLSWTILVGGAITAGLALYMVVICYSSLPWSDGWAQIFVAASGKSPFSPHWLWQQHNEHRMVIPKLLLGIDLRLFAARQTFLLACIYLIEFVHWCVLAWSMRVLGGWGGALWRTGAGLAAFCLFCPTQWQNLVWGFQTCFVLPPLFATLSFVGLLLYAKTQRGKFVVLSVIAAIAAVGSLANGLVLLPLLAITALALELRKPVVLTYATAAVVAFAVYFHGYTRPEQNTDPLSSVRLPGKLLGYLATYFGSSWTAGHSWDGHNLRTAEIAGAFGLAALLLFVLRFRALRARAGAFSIQLLLLGLFCVGTALLTALGRAGSGNGQAFSSRYQTIALLFWWSAACLLLIAAEGYRQTAVMAVQVLFLLVLLRGAALVRLPLGDAREHAFNRRAATAALLTGVDDRRQISEAYPYPEQVLQVAPFMRQARLSVFAGGKESLLGAAIDSIAPIGEGRRCEGELQSVTAIGAGDLRITGWAWDRKQHRPVDRVLTISSEKVIGFGAVGEWRPAIRAVHREMNSSLVGFTAYARNAAQSKVDIYAVVDGGSPQACTIATIQGGPYSDVK